MSNLKGLAPQEGSHWGNYIKGVMFALADSEPPACDIAIATSVPLGGGLSSSAALEVFFAIGLYTHTKVGMYSFLQASKSGAVENTKEKALACQKAEQNFAHVPCGMMDQVIATLAERDHALLLDCLYVAVCGG